MKTTRDLEIRAAIERLLSGHAIHAKGRRPSISALAKEAGVSRQTLYRAEAGQIVADFRRHLVLLGREPLNENQEVTRLKEQLAESGLQLGARRQELKSLREELEQKDQLIQTLSVRLERAAAALAEIRSSKVRGINSKGQGNRNDRTC